LGFARVSTLRSRPGFPVTQRRQLKQIAEAIYEALPQTPLLFLSQKEAKKLLKHKNFAFCGKRPRALPFGNLRFFEKNRVKL